jgi:acyl-CoA thioester hydrolase
MFQTILEPRFSETDILGHINNTVFPVWFEVARQDIFKLVHPKLTRHDWPMIIAHIDVDFISQTEYGSNVTVNTSVQKIGNKSFVLAHEAWQSGSLVAKGSAALVWFDYIQQSSHPIPEKICALLQKHLQPVS